MFGVDNGEVGLLVYQAWGVWDVFGNDGGEGLSSRQFVVESAWLVNLVIRIFRFNGTVSGRKICYWVRITGVNPNVHSFFSE